MSMLRSLPWAMSWVGLRKARSAPADEYPSYDTVQHNCACQYPPVLELINAGVWQLLERPTVAQAAVIAGGKS